MDVLQPPLSLVFTRLLNLFSGTIPEFETAYAGIFLGSFAGRIIILLFAIALTGAGALLLSTTGPAAVHY